MNGRKTFAAMYDPSEPPPPPHVVFLGWAGTDVGSVSESSHTHRVSNYRSLQKVNVAGNFFGSEVFVLSSRSKVFFVNIQTEKLNTIIP